MSVIAWDGKTLAADKRAVMGTLIVATTKIFRITNYNEGGALVGYAGDAAAGEEMLHWFKNGAIPEKLPAAQRDKNDWVGLLVIWATGAIWKYENTPHPVKLMPQKFAIGSGRDFGLAAMHLGKTAKEAVEIACLFDNTCGDGVDVLTHDYYKAPLNEDIQKWQSETQNKAYHSHIAHRLGENTPAPFGLLGPQ